MLGGLSSIEAKIHSIYEEEEEEEEEEEKEKEKEEEKEFVIESLKTMAMVIDYAKETANLELLLPQARLSPPTAMLMATCSLQPDGPQPSSAILQPIRDAEHAFFMQHCLRLADKQPSRALEHFHQLLRIRYLSNPPQTSNQCYVGLQTDV